MTLLDSAAVDLRFGAAPESGRVGHPDRSIAIDLDSTSLPREH
jgi:hypothetical protein